MKSETRATSKPWLRLDTDSCTKLRSLKTLREVQVPTDQPSGLSKADIVETPAIGQIEKASASPPAKIDQGRAARDKTGTRKDNRRNSLMRWLLSAPLFFAVGMAVAVWYLRRPLPPLQ